MVSARLTYAFVSMPLFLTALQYHMVSVGFADIVADLSAPFRWVGWVITVFTVASAATQPVAGRLGDRFGSRTVFAAGLFGFAGASALCALAPNVWMLIGARALQGVSGGLLMPTAFALVAAAFPDRRAQAVGLLSSIVPIGTLVGPNLGGVIVEQFGWRATFVLNVPLAVLLAVGALLLVPAVPAKSTVSIDFRGAALLAFIVTGVVYSLTEVGGGAAAPLVGVPLVASVLAAVVFVRHERRVAVPVIDVDLLRTRAFAVTNLLNFMYGAALLGLFGFVPLYVQTFYDMSPTASGLVLTPRAIAMVGVSTLAALTLPRMGYRRPIGLGLVVMGTSALVLSLGLSSPTIFGVAVSDFVWVTLVVTFIGVAYGMIGPALNNAGLDLAPDRVAAIAGLRGTFRSVGGAVGTAFVVLVVAWAPDVATGLEVAFACLGVVALACLALLRWIPEPERRPSPVPEPTPAGGRPPS